MSLSWVSCLGPWWVCLEVPERCWHRWTATGPREMSDAGCLLRVARFKDSASGDSPVSPHEGAFPL